MKIWRNLSKFLGPGLISGASDDDPSSIGTYVQGGAQFGLGVSWLALFQLPLMTAVQEMSARIGLTTGSGIGRIMRKNYPKKVVLPIMVLLLVSNTITIGADIGAMGAAVQVLVPKLPAVLITVFFAAFILSTEIFFTYARYARMLKFTTLVLFSYVAAAFVININWNQVALSTLLPHFEISKKFLLMFVAFFGATLSPYVFFWQSYEEAEEEVARKKIKELGQGKPSVTRKEIGIMRADSVLGMAFSQIIMWFIIVVTASTLHSGNVLDVQTVAQAAKALEPLVHNFPNAGKIAEVLFALGIVGTGLLAIPVIAGSSAYVMSDGLGWRQGLSKKFGQAKGFYLIIIGSTVVGLWINLVHFDTITALVDASIINAVISVPLLVIILKICNNKKILGSKTNGLLSNLLGLAATAIMCASAVFVLAILYWQKVF